MWQLVCDQSVGCNGKTVCEGDPIKAAGGGGRYLAYLSVWI